MAQRNIFPNRQTPLDGQALLENFKRMERAINRIGVPDDDGVVTQTNFNFYATGNWSVGADGTAGLSGENVGLSAADTTSVSAVNEVTITSNTDTVQLNGKDIVLLATGAGTNTIEFNAADGFTFVGTTQTGVAVNAAAIHAALVNLGLITA